jgi:hypothetical protein
MSDQVQSGLTVEMVDAMQDEMNKIGEDGVSDADKVKADDDAAKLAEAKAVEDAAKLKADEDAAKLKEAENKAKEEEVDVVRELKEQLRVNAESLKKAVGDYQKLQKIMIDKGVITEDEVKAGEAEEVAAKTAFTERQNKLIEMVTIMELNPTYTDVRAVCSQGNLDDVIDAFSRFYVKENGGKQVEVAAAMEKEIWSEPNPYKKIYELVKKYHPKYAEKPAETDEQKKVREAEEATKKIAADADKVKEKKVIESNPSAANLGAGGGGAGGSGWTAAKIDALDEEELKSVPKDIYEKYMLGTLA